MRYDRECTPVRRKQTKRLRLLFRKWLRGDVDAPEPRYRNSQGWVTW